MAPKKTKQAKSKRASSSQRGGPGGDGDGGSFTHSFSNTDERKIVIYTVHVSLHRTDDSQVSLPAATAAAKKAKAAAKSRAGKGKAKKDADAAAAGSDDDDEQKQMDVQEEDGPAGLDAVPADNDQQPPAVVDSDDESASGGVIGEMEVDAAKAGNGGEGAEEEGNFS